MRFSILILTLLLSTQFLRAEIIPVMPGGSIKTAIQKAKGGDTVMIHSGIYEESQITVDKSIVLLGNGMPIIDGSMENEILTVVSDSVVIQGIEFRNAGMSHIKDLAAIRIKRCDHYAIINNRIINAFFGIYIENGNHGLIENNVLIGQAENEMNSGNAIHGWYAEHLMITCNYIQQYRDGIYLEFVHHSTVSDNISVDNIRYGLHFMFSNDDSYSCNEFRNNGAGVAVMFSKRIQMRENLFEYNWGAAAYGLLLKEIYDADIWSNQFSQNTIGIMVEGSARVEYSHNEFSGNGWAIQMSGGCLDNDFYRNNFLSNTLDLVVNSRVNNNTFNGNFWSEYSGYDLDKDGTGDVPHRPVKLYSYVLNEAPESIVLLRSFFIDLLNYAEKVTPVFTPENVLDHKPLINKVS